MKQNLISMFVLFIGLTFGLQTISAQINITIPKLPKIKKDKQAEQSNPSSSNDTSPDDIETNPDAPSNYDANLKSGDQAIAINHLRLLKPVRIVAKSGATYKTIEIGDSDSTKWYSANSVYPYFDKQELTNVTLGNNDYLNPYLECYAKKHNLEIDKVTGDAFSPRRFSNAREMKQKLQAEQPKLAEIAGQLKNKLQSRPDTFLDFHENPGIWEEITTNRESYLQCAASAKDELRVSESVWLQAHLEDIAKQQREVDTFTSGQDKFVGAYNVDYVLLSISQREREKWDGYAEFKDNLDPALDALAASVARKIPLRVPKTTNFAFRNPASETMLKGALPNPSTLKIYKIGLADTNWQIEKNGLGIPTVRFKEGYLWARNSADDHPYCWLYKIDIIQSYSGGGTFGSSYSKLIATDLYSCPAGN